MIISYLVYASNIVGIHHSKEIVGENVFRLCAYASIAGISMSGFIFMFIFICYNVSKQI